MFVSFVVNYNIHFDDKVYYKIKILPQINAQPSLIFSNQIKVYSVAQFYKGPVCWKL